ncbi:MAG: acyl carrier protein [Solidesulfovibrio sp.]
MAVTGAALVDVLRLAGIEEKVIAAVRPDTPLLLQGLDSVDFPSFVAALEERYHVEIPEEKAWSLRTLDDFAALLDSLGTP